MKKKEIISDTNNFMAILQDSKSQKVLTLGWINGSLLKKTILENQVFLEDQSFNDLYSVEQILFNKEKDKVLIKVKTNKLSDKFNLLTEFEEENKNPYSYLGTLEKKIQKSINGEAPNSHVNSVMKKGKTKIAQKLGEEVVELVIESGKDNDLLFADEAADVLYYYLILLHERGFTLPDILKQLKLQKRKI